MARRPTPPPIPFNKKLVLNQYILSLLGVDDFKHLADALNKPENEGVNEEGFSLFHFALINGLSGYSAFDADVLLAYDTNIISHTRAIQGRRSEPIRWKYFQYLALLFTEIYLDRYFSHRQNLLDDLNEFLATFNTGKSAREKLPPFDLDDLRRIAFWSATGSGKTLIMHMNIKQVQHYIRKTGQERAFNRILLITPNEGLSHQHLVEMKLSGINAEIFVKGGRTLLHGDMVEIIDIHKLADRDGDKTVAVDSFEQNNFVLIDEGHRGSSGDVWGRYRRSLAREGFAIEYSATLGQAAAGNNDLSVRYSKSILFDYSYRHFYGDGYGKEYRIFNLPENDGNETRELYLTACMLAFYQQKRLFGDREAKVDIFNVENPLCVFVGSSVNAVRRENNQQVSDVIDLLLFLARLTDPAKKAEVIARIEQIKNGSASLTDADGNQVFANMFTHIASMTITAEEIYDDMLSKVFNANSGALLHLDELKGADGEIALRLGNNEDFGVINVGDASTLCKLCAAHDGLEVAERNFTVSLFRDLDKQHSNIHLLIGSKRFTEGWNSWRVSTMGMMNVGRNEGSQVIQLFGRGVRLRGFKGGLKRHSALVYEGIDPNDKLTVLETLNIFGVRANYMQQFRRHLENEGVPTPDNVIEISVPVVNQLSGKNLKTIKIPDGLDFRKDGGKHVLSAPSPALRTNKVVLDYYPRIQSQVAEGISVTTTPTSRHSGKIPFHFLTWLDYDAIYFDLQKLKKTREWFNLCIDKQAIKSILSDTSWYDILIPQEQYDSRDLMNIQLWQDIATSLMQKYCDQFYKANKSAWEAPHREYKKLLACDPNFISEHKVFIDKSQTSLIGQIRALKNQIMSTLPTTDTDFGPNKAIFFAGHLYQPLFALGNHDLRVQPVSLNKGEKIFIENLRGHISANSSFFDDKETYILRNLSRGRGLGFFEAGNFYPDFILWLINGSHQTIAFIDPKGIGRLSPTDPKLSFHTTIKAIESNMANKDVKLCSFIISVSPYDDIKNSYVGMSEDDFKAKNVLFQNNPNYIADLFNLLQR